ncbi:MAG TPA: CaiB/BaiF CoA-transferase family protein [Ramlibacter sp.]|nr:CaiB/BaiF CoA-transferase family protein [Ramlibacter sp.]
MKIGEIIHPERAAYGKPLEGVRILALEQQQAMPYATQLMARLGAEVVRVEHPERGETGRDTFPAMTDPQGRRTGTTFLRNNLDKRSICIDIKSPKGRELLLQLAPRFDVWAENFRAGTLERLGLGYEDVARVHPKVVYASISGFGADGKSPYTGWSAFAPVVEAMSAFYDFKRWPEDPPVVGVAGAVGDTATGLFTVIGILSALRHRDRIGVGQHVDVAMYDCMVSLVDLMINYWSMGKPSTLKPPSVTAAFRAKDGFFVMMCSRRAQFKILAEMVGCPQWLDDPRLATPIQWGERIEDIIRPAVERWAANRTRAEASELLNRAGVAVGPCQSVEEMMADPHVIARNMIVSMERTDGIAQPILTPGNPVKLSKMAEGPERRVPWLGEHTEEVLAAELGLDAEELARLRADRVVA